ncbi:hypothetical protein PENSPDRAFT_671826 [Peniophora sp. CONT]|nr:hypothetical protein PENSPDRAFT_671826 [Peniophora sp. CONT]
MLPIGIVYAFLAGFTGLIAGWSAYHCTDLVFSIRMLAGLKPLVITATVPTATSVLHATATLSEAVPCATATLNHAWTPQYLLLDMAPSNKVVRVPVDAVYYQYEEDAALHTATATPSPPTTERSLVSATPLKTSSVEKATDAPVLEEHVSLAAILVVVGTLFTLSVLAIAVASLCGFAQKARLDFADAQRKEQLAFYKANEIRTSYTDMFLPTDDSMSPAIPSALSQIEVVDLAPRVVSPLAQANNRIELDLDQVKLEVGKVTDLPLTHSQAPVALHADLASSDSLTTDINNDAPNAHAHHDSLQSMLEVDRPAALDAASGDLATQEAPAPPKAKRMIQVTPEERRARRSKGATVSTNRYKTRLALKSFSRGASAPPPGELASVSAQSDTAASSLALATPVNTIGTSELVIVVQDVAEDPALEKVADEMKVNENDLLAGAQAVTHFTPTAQPAALSASLVEPTSEVAQDISAPELELKVKPSPEATPARLVPTVQGDISALFKKRDAYTIADKDAIDEPEDFATDRLSYEAKGKWRATTPPVEVGTGAQVQQQQQQQPPDEDAQVPDGESDDPPLVLPASISEEELAAQPALFEFVSHAPRPSPSSPALFVPGSSKMASSEIVQETPASVTELSVTQAPGVPVSPAPEHPQLEGEDVLPSDEHPSQGSPSLSLLNVYEEDPDVQSVLWTQYSSPAALSSSELEEANDIKPPLTEAFSSPPSATQELPAVIVDAQTPVVEDSTQAQDEGTAISLSLGFTSEELDVQSALLAAYRPPTPPPSSPASSDQAVCKVANVEPSPAQASGPLQMSPQEPSAIFNEAKSIVIEGSTAPSVAQYWEAMQNEYTDDVAPSSVPDYWEVMQDLYADDVAPSSTCPEVDDDMDTENVDAQDTVMQNKNEAYPATDAGMDLEERDPSDPGANDYYGPLNGGPDDDDDMALDNHRRIVPPPPMDIDFDRIRDPQYQRVIDDGLREMDEQELADVEAAEAEGIPWDNPMAPYYAMHVPAYAVPPPFTPSPSSEFIGYDWRNAPTPPPPEQFPYMPAYDNGYIPTRPCTPEPEDSRAPTPSSSHASTARLPHRPPPLRRPSTPYDNEYEVDYGTDDDDGDDEDDDAPQPPGTVAIPSAAASNPSQTTARPREGMPTDDMVMAAELLRMLKKEREGMVRPMNSSAFDFTALPPRTGNSNLNLLANVTSTLPPAPATPPAPTYAPPPTLVPYPSGVDIRFMNLTQRVEWFEMQRDLKGTSYIRRRLFDLEGQGGVAELDDEVEMRSKAVKGTFEVKTSSVAGDTNSVGTETEDAMDAGSDPAGGASRRARKRKNQQKNRHQREEYARIAAENERLAQQAAEAEAKRLKEERQKKLQDAILFMEQEPMRRAEEERREREEAKRLEEEAKEKEEREREKALRPVKPVPRRPAPFTFNVPRPAPSLSAPTTAVEPERPAGTPIFHYEPTWEVRQKMLDAEQEKSRRETAATIARLKAERDGGYHGL